MKSLRKQLPKRLQRLYSLLRGVGWAHACYFTFDDDHCSATNVRFRNRIAQLRIVLTNTDQEVVSGRKGYLLTDDPVLLEEFNTMRERQAKTRLKGVGRSKRQLRRREQKELSL